MKRRLHQSNYFINCGEYYEFWTFKKDGRLRTKVKIDKDDYEKVKKFKWSINSQGYAQNNDNREKLHVYLMGRKSGLVIDHINRDKLDNRKSNLRHVPLSVNSFNRVLSNNTSGCAGVMLVKGKNKWRVGIGVDNKHIFLGYFYNKQDAITARKKAEIKYYNKYV